ERIGYRIGGVLLLVVGWGLGVVLNITLHRLAPAAGQAIGPWRIYPALGSYAWSVVALGLVAGVVGVVMLWLAQRAPPGKFALPGYSY
ncbi:MAG: hypothetical protein L3J97_04295, partial [Thermoplasmata archaeon]|nr:hypothetical protein [Thermoplasmata archaeon]